MITAGVESTDTRQPDYPPTIPELRIKPVELSTSRLTPACIVPDYLYADVVLLVAPGGIGKTTLVLFEAICIILGLPVHGLKVEKTGRILIITKEDRREQLIARIREIMSDNGLNGEDEQKVMDCLLIWDLSGEPVNLVSLEKGIIKLSPLADNIVQAFKDDPPVMVIIDPVVSFGASEALINDNEQAIITACRRIVRGLSCCVRLIHHTGKMNARMRMFDQYTGRGGSALPDGSRSVTVLQIYKRDGKQKLPAGCIETPGSSICMLARPKLSYSPPDLPLIYIKRTGWKYESFTDGELSDKESEEAIFERVCSFLADEVKAGRRHNKTSLEKAIPGMTRETFRNAINKLMKQDRIVEIDLPIEEQITKRKKYLTVSAGFGSIPETRGDENDNKTGLIMPPP